MPSSTTKYSPQDEQSLMAAIWDPRIADDLNAFVMFMYPWGQAGTPLANLHGPRKWQKRVLQELTDYIKAAKTDLALRKNLLAMFKKAIASGRGIGKSALFAWLAHWLVSTRLGSSVWVAANGEPQLKTKTFPEISKWVSLGMNSHWFDINATSIVPAPWLTELVKRDLKIDPKYWYIQAQLWSEENPDAFAGAHNGYGEMYLFDEASGIPSPIWTVAEGVFTELIVDRYWLAFSNPRRNDGAFFECFHKNRDEWRPLNINALEVEGIAHDTHHAIIKKFGQDSDEARVEVFGMFPNRAENQFISNSLVNDASKREVYRDAGAPLLMGVDVARGDRDYNVIAFRQGRDARSIPWERFLSTSTVTVANKVAELAQRYKADAIFVDGNGVGAGVVDMLKDWKYRVIEVQAGAGPNDENKYLNKRAEFWALYKEWLGTGAIPDSPVLIQDSTGPQYKYHEVNNKLILESKEHMRDRGLASPDMADALAMTFAQTIARNDSRVGRGGGNRSRIAEGVDCAIFD